MDLEHVRKSRNEVIDKSGLDISSSGFYWQSFNRKHLGEVYQIAYFYWIMVNTVIKLLDFHYWQRIIDEWIIHLFLDIPLVVSTSLIGDDARVIAAYDSQQCFRTREWFFMLIALIRVFDWKSGHNNVEAFIWKVCLQKIFKKDLRTKLNSKASVTSPPRKPHLNVFSTLSFDSFDLGLLYPFYCDEMSWNKNELWINPLTWLIFWLIYYRFLPD